MEISCYVFRKVEEKTKTKLMCVSSTKDYNLFENNRATKERNETDKRPATKIGGLYVRLTQIPKYFKYDIQDKCDRAIALKEKSVSSIFFADGVNSVGYGDFANDALIFTFNNFCYDGKQIKKGSELTIYVFKGGAINKKGIYNGFLKGTLNNDLAIVKTEYEM